MVELGQRLGLTTQSGWRWRIFPRQRITLEKELEEMMAAARRRKLT
jgi:hypothetical protein